MKNLIFQDLFRYGLKGYVGLFKGFYIPGFAYTYIFRKASKYSRRSILGIFYRFLLRSYSYKYGIQIPAGTKIGGGFYIGHFGNIVVSIKATVGQNCNVAQGVTIGATNRGKSAGAPVIGNNVWIGANAVLVGKINVGSNVLIAPLTFVNFDVPSNSVVVGSPPRIIPNDSATKGYINNINTTAC